MSVPLLQVSEKRLIINYNFYGNKRSKNTHAIRPDMVGISGKLI